jgi:predicted DNA binding CopG/RHH family protein
MQYYELDKEEQAELDKIESGEMQSVSDLQEAKQEAVRAAKSSLNKTLNINIRLSERDVYKLKAKAAKEGLPYQTLAASILHKTASR